MNQNTFPFMLYKKTSSVYTNVTVAKMPAFLVNYKFFHFILFVALRHFSLFAIVLSIHSTLFAKLQ